jgi:hypothetical protein
MYQNCSFCKSPNTTKLTCPLNSDAKNKSPGKHPFAIKSRKRLLIGGADQQKMTVIPAFSDTFAQLTRNFYITGEKEFKEKLRKYKKDVRLKMLDELEQLKKMSDSFNNVHFTTLAEVENPNSFAHLAIVRLGLWGSQVPITVSKKNFQIMPKSQNTLLVDFSTDKVLLASDKTHRGERFYFPFDFIEDERLRTVTQPIKLGSSQSFPLKWSGFKQLLQSVGQNTPDLRFLRSEIKFHNTDLMPANTKTLYREMVLDTSVCQWRLNDDFIKEAFDMTNSMITIETESSYWRDKLNVTKILAFVLFRLDFTNGLAKIFVICSEGLPGITFGSILLCLVHAWAANEGFVNIYLDASNSLLIKYYTKNGYIIGKKPCGQTDPDQEVHRKHIRETPDIPYHPPQKYETNNGYRMKNCNLDLDFCKATFNQFSERIQKAEQTGIVDQIYEDIG